MRQEEAMRQESLATSQGHTKCVHFKKIANPRSFSVWKRENRCPLFIDEHISKKNDTLQKSPGITLGQHQMHCRASVLVIVMLYV